MLTDDQVNAIAERVLALLNQRDDSRPIRAPIPSERHELPIGIFATVDDAVQAAAEAQRQLMRLTLAKRDEIITSMRTVLREHAADLAKQAHAETGLGRVEDKIRKNLLAIEKTPGMEDLAPVARTGDRGLMLMEPAPYGVIAAITPVTNPTATIICNAIGMVAAGNGVVFNVHPNAQKVSIQNVHLINEAIVKVGGPPNLVSAIAAPTIESAQELMRHGGVRLLVVTGGPGVVKEAMNSGKRAICAGPGNPPIVVDETADIEKAARDIVIGASLDNNIICVDEKELFVVDSVADELTAAMSKQGAVCLDPVQRRQLERLIFTKMDAPGKPAEVDKALVGKNAGVILSRLGIVAGDDLRLIVVEVEKSHPLVWTEQMIPVLPLVRVASADEGIDLAKEVEGGLRHTAVMHSRNIDNLSRMAREMDCSIFVKNGPGAAGLGFGGEGYCSFSIASPTGEGLTRPRSFTRERRCTLVDHFRIT
ncbi:MAG: aldehyde dehydrogenase family protein [bacterium]